MSSLTPEDSNYFTPPSEEPTEQLGIPGLERLGEVADKLAKAADVQVNRPPIPPRPPNAPATGGPLKVTIVDIEEAGLDKLAQNLAAQIDRIEKVLKTGVQPSAQAVTTLNQTEQEYRSLMAQTRSHQRELIGLEDIRTTRAHKLDELLTEQSSTLVENMRQQGMTEWSSQPGDPMHTMHVRYRTETDPGSESIPVEQARTSIEAFQAARSSGRKPLTPQELEGEQLLVDLAARRENIQENINRERMTTVRTIRHEGQLEQENLKSLHEAQKLLGLRSSSSVIRELRTRGILQRVPGEPEGIMRGIPVTIGGRTSREDMTQTQIRELLDSFHRARMDVSKMSEVEQARYQGFQTELQDRIRGGRAPRGTASIRDVLTALASGDYGAVVREGFQAVPGLGGVSRSWSERAERMVAQGVATRAAGGLLGRLGGLTQQGGGIALGSLATKLLTPAGILGGFELGRLALGQYRGNLQLGQITGEGAGAGVAARFRSFEQGINPFDILSSGMALQIQRGVRTQGFSGDTANRISATLGDLVNKGIGDWQSNLNELVPMIHNSANGMQNFNEILGTFSATMHTLRDQARETNTSVADLAKGFGEFAEPILQAGGSLQIAATRFTAANNAFARITAFQGTGQQTRNQWLASIGPMAQMASGIAPWNVQVGSRNWARAIERLIDQVRSQKPTNMSWKEYARMLSYTATTIGVPPIFAGLGYGAIYELLTKGVGLSGAVTEAAGQQGVDEAHQRESAISSNYDDRSAAARFNPAQSRIVFRQERRAEQTYIQQIAGTLRSSGMSRQEIDKILAPLYQTEITRVGQSNDPFQRAQQQVEHVIKIDLSQHAKKYLTTKSDKETNWYYGTGSGVGVTRSDG